MDNKKVLNETGRWVRVGVLTVSTLGPIAGSLLTRLREQQVLAKATAQPPEPLQVQPVGIAEKPSLSESLALLKERAYNQELVRRAEELAEELRIRSTRLSQAVAERSTDLTHELGKRSSDLTHELSKRSNDLTHELSKRSSDLSHELGKRSEKVSKRVRKQTRQVSRNLSEQDSTFWIISGFSVGLLAASLAAFLLIRSRLKQQEADQDEHILLSQNGHLSQQNGTNGQAPTKSPSSSLPSSALPNTPTNKPAAAVVSTPVAAPVATPQSVPTDAAFLGLANTKRYYPAQTPLDQLATTADQPLDIIYFASEEEAQAQGFTAAEK